MDNFILNLIDAVKKGDTDQITGHIIEMYENDKIQSADDLGLLKRGIENVFKGVKEYIDQENISYENNTNGFSFTLSKSSVKAPAWSKLKPIFNKKNPEINQIIDSASEIQKQIEKGIKNGNKITPVVYQYFNPETGEVSQINFDVDTENIKPELKKGSWRIASKKD